MRNDDSQQLSGNDTYCRVHIKGRYYSFNSLSIAAINRSVSEGLGA
jgi:hypothetical protein